MDNKLNLSEILNNIKNTQFNSEIVFIPQFNSEVEVRELTGEQYLNCSINSSKTDIEKGTYLVNAIIYSVYTIDGERLFNSDNHIENVNLVNNLKKKTYLLLVDAVTKVNRETDQKN